MREIFEEWRNLIPRDVTETSNID